MSKSSSDKGIKSQVIFFVILSHTETNLPKDEQN